MLHRADSYLSEDLKLDCEIRAGGLWGLSGPAMASPGSLIDALFIEPLAVVDFGTSADLVASTPVSCGLGMAFVEDPSRPKQNKVSDTACAITCPPPLYPRRWTFTGPYLQWRGLLIWMIWHVTLLGLIAFTFSYSWILPEHYKDNYHWFWMIASLLFTMEVNWGARYIAVRNVPNTSRRSHCTHRSSGTCTSPTCSLKNWMLPVSEQKELCGKFPAHLMLRKDGRMAESGDLFISMNGLVVYLMFLFCVVWLLTKEFTLSPENVKLCLKHYPWTKKYIPRCLMKRKKKASFADRLISSMTSSVAAMDSTASTDFSSMDSTTTAASTTMHSAA